MSWLNNFKISFKIGLIVALMAIVTIGAVSYAAVRMKGMNDAYSDLVGRLDKSTIAAVRASRRAENYLSSAFQLAVETSAEGNVKYLAQAVDSRKSFETAMAQVVKDLPENSVVLGAVVANYAKAFGMCDPALQNAAKTSTQEENVKAAERLTNECAPLIEFAIKEHAKVTDMLVAGSDKASRELSDQTTSTILMVLIASGVGLLLGLAIAMFIGIKGLASPIRDLLAAMAALARNDLEALVPGIVRRDEIGDMARNVEVFKTNAIEVERLKAQLQVSEQQAVVD